MTQPLKKNRYSRKALDVLEDYQRNNVGTDYFQYTCPKCRTFENTKGLLWYTHHDETQLLAEAGIAGFCLLSDGMIYSMYRTIQFIKKRIDSFAIYIGIVLLAATTALAIHYYSVFYIHMPVNYLMFETIVAIGYSASLGKIK